MSIEISIDFKADKYVYEYQHMRSTVFILFHDYAITPCLSLFVLADNQYK